MEFSETSASEAAEVVLKERERERRKEQEKREKSVNRETQLEDQRPELETVSVPKWDGAENGAVDESELDRRQRALSRQLEQKQLEVQRQGRKLAKVREELKALEQPIKEEIMKLRESLEDANRREIVLVNSVNSLRQDLFKDEQTLKEVRDEKQTFADNLIRVMADYEKRKTERLNEIAELVGSEPIKKNAVKHNFAGF